MKDLPRFEDGTEKRYVADSYTLFYRRDDGNLVPVAIQLQPKADALIYTPKDGRGDWLLAKTFAKCAEVAVHQTISHLLRTHLVIEPFAVATQRNLSSAHPLYKLLKRHLKYTIAINMLARQTLIGPGGLFDEISALGGKEAGHIQCAQRGYTQLNWTLDHAHLPTDLELRGVMSKDVLPYYPYRDDGLLMWHAIEKYVTGVESHPFANQLVH